MKNALRKWTAGLLAACLAVQLGGFRAEAAGQWEDPPLPEAPVCAPGPREPESRDGAQTLPLGLEEEGRACLDAQARFEAADQEARALFSNEDAQWNVLALAGDSGVERSGSSVYANGVPILIRGESGGVYIYDETGTRRLFDDPIDPSVSIFGGGNTGDVDSTRIILESGTVANLIGGGRSGSVSGTASIELRGGTVTGLVCGGGKDAASRTGETVITATGSPAAKWIYGGGYEGSVTGGATLSLGGGVYQYVSGGGFSGPVGGDIRLTLTDAAVEDTVFGGGWNGPVGGFVHTTLSGTGSAVFLCGGGYQSDVEGGVSVSIDGGAVSQGVYGGGWSGGVNGDASVAMTDGRAGVLYGGGFEGPVAGKAKIAIMGGSVESAVYGGGQQERAAVRETEVRLSGGSVGWAYGGGVLGAVSETAALRLEGGTVTGVAYGGGRSAPVGRTQVTVAAPAQTPVLYGGGQAGAAGNTSVVMEGGVVGSLYGGGREASAQTETTSVQISGGQVDYLYGGGYQGPVSAQAGLSITGGTVKSAYGGGWSGSAGAATVTLSGGSVGWVYAGGNSGAVLGTASLDIGGDAAVLNNAFGGGRGPASSVRDTLVSVTGGAVKSVFAGGDQGSVSGSAQLTLASAGRTDFACGGAYSGTAGQAAAIVESGSVGTLYGGSYTGTTASARISMKSGAVDQLVCGDGAADSGSQAELLLSGGLVSECYPGRRGALRLCVDGGSLLRTYTGAAGFVNSGNQAVYPVKIYVGNPVLASQPVTCAIGAGAWTSQTDVGGKLLTYLPEGEASIRVTAGTQAYSGQALVNSGGTAVCTLLLDGAPATVPVSFSVKGGGGALAASVDGLPIASGDGVALGKTVLFEARTDEGYQLKSWWVDGAPAAASGLTYTVEGLSSEITVQVEFEAVRSMDGLRSAISEAEAEKASAAVSLDGSDIPPDAQWVTRPVMDALLGALQTARAALTDGGLSQQEIDRAAGDLNGAVLAFRQAKRPGTSDGGGQMVDRQALNRALTALTESLAQVLVSADGSDVDADRYWVTQEALDAIQAAAGEARTVADAPGSTQAQVDGALAALQAAERAFQEAKQPGTKQPGWNVTFGAGPGGAVSARINGQPAASPCRLAPGEVLVLTALPDDGMRVAGWSHNGSAVNDRHSTYTLSGLDGDADIQVTFQEAERAYQASVDGGIVGGLVSLSPSGMVYPGTEITVSVLPDEGYLLEEGSLRCNGTEITGGRFLMPRQDVLVTARFVPGGLNRSYRLTVSALTGGTACGTGDYQPGEQVEIRAEAGSGYAFQQWSTADGTYLEDPLSAVTRITMPAMDLRVDAVFTQTSGGQTPGGGPSGGQATAPKPEAEVKISGAEKGTALISINCKPDAAGTAAVSLGAGEVRQAVRAAQNGGGMNGLSIRLSAEERSLEAVQLSVSRQALELLQESGLETLVLTGVDGVSLRLEAGLLKLITPASGGEAARISMARAKTEELSRQAVEMLDGRPAYQLGLRAGQRDVTEFEGGSVLIQIPYALRDGETKEEIKGCYVDGGGLASVFTASEYREEEQCLVLTVPHFSVFGVTRVSGAPQAAPGFLDLENHWAREEILYLAGLGAVKGISSARFDPEGTADRGMLVTILGRLAGVEASQGSETGFSDVPAQSYCAPYVAWAGEQGITKGTGGGRFSPELPVTREQLATMLYAFAQTQGLSLEEVNPERTFTDAEMVSPWAIEAVSAMQRADIVLGKDGGRFAPGDSTTRAELCAMLARLLAP